MWPDAVRHFLSISPILLTIYSAQPISEDESKDSKLSVRYGNGLQEEKKTVSLRGRTLQEFVKLVNVTVTPVNSSKGVEGGMRKASRRDRGVSPH